MTQNEKEIELLEKDPNALIVKYQDVIEIIVNKFIHSGGISFSGKDEIIQIINEKLLLSIERIREQYKGISLLKTYFSTIIKNICLEEINKKNRYGFTELENANNDNLLENNFEQEFYLKEEFDRLSNILYMFHKSVYKLVLCLKIIFRLPLTSTDIANYCKKLKTNEIESLIEAVDPVKIIPEFELFETLALYTNKCDKKINQPDTLRRWTSRKIDEIIELMNGNPPRANYDKETIQILIEKYFIKKEE